MLEARKRDVIFARAEGVGLPEGEARAAKRSQEAERNARKSHRLASNPQFNNQTKGKQT